MSIVFGIDTSSTDLSIGLFRDGQPMASYSRLIKNSHAEHITQAITAFLDTNRLQPADITHIAIAAGPGSFTGLRIGFAFVKGLCMTGSIKVMPVSSLSVLASAALGRATWAVAAIDARRNEVFWARFRVDASQVVRESPDTAGTELTFKNFLKGDDTVVTDTLGYAHSTIFNFLAGRTNVLSVERTPVERGLCCAAAGVAALSNGPSWKNAADAIPEYLRSFTPLSSPKGL